MQLDLSELERRAAEKHAGSMTALGKLALVGRAGGRSVGEGLQLLAAAAEGGDAEADAMIAVLIGIDARARAEWERALDYLRRAASRGLGTARAQLALWCPDPALVAASQAPSPEAPLWKQMRETIDVGALVRLRVPTTVRSTPHIAIYEGFASRGECAWVMARARPHLERARIFDQQGRARSAAVRTNSAAQFDILKADFALIVLHARIAAASGFAVRCLEETNVLHYAAGEEFTPHYDFFTPDNPEFQRELVERGQRATTFLIYLNDEFEGGETHFEKLDWRYRGRPGDAILFRNVTPAGDPDPFTLHAGLPPSSGEKWLLSQWIRSHPPGQKNCPAPGNSA